VSNWIANATADSYMDAPGPPAFYKLSAVDVNGNESGFATVLPSGTAAMEDGGVAVFALTGVSPNPSAGSRLSVAFTLPDGEPAKLELLDAAGRRVAGRGVGALGAGRHTVDLSPSGRLAPGIYLVRLTQGAQVRTNRVAVVR
jgi:hypothetical protein